MEKYLEKEYKGAVSSLKLCQGVAKDSGNPYYYLSLTFVNGYERRLFLNDDQRFAISNAFDTIDTAKILNIED